MFNPPHPGEGLKDILAAIPMSITDFAAYIGMSRTNFSRILSGKAGITPDVSIRLAQAFGQKQTDIWYKMQAAHDFWVVSQVKRKQIRAIRSAA